MYSLDLSVAKVDLSVSTCGRKVLAFLSQVIRMFYEASSHTNTIIVIIKIKFLLMSCRAHISGLPGRGVR